MEKVHQLTSYYKEHGVFCNDPRNLLNDDLYGQDYNERREIWKLLD